MHSCLHAMMVRVFFRSFIYSVILHRNQYVIWIHCLRLIDKNVSCMLYDAFIWCLLVPHLFFLLTIQSIWFGSHAVHFGLFKNIRLFLYNVHKKRKTVQRTEQGDKNPLGFSHRKKPKLFWEILYAFVFSVCVFCAVFFFSSKRLFYQSEVEQNQAEIK